MTRFSASLRVAARFRRRFGVAVLVMVSSTLGSEALAAAPNPSLDDEAWPQQIEADWAAQERRWGRVAGSAQAVREAWQRSERLLADLARALPQRALEPEAGFLLATTPLFLDPSPVTLRASLAESAGNARFRHAGESTAGRPAE